MIVSIIYIFIDIYRDLKTVALSAVSYLYEVQLSKFSFFLLFFLTKTGYKSFNPHAVVTKQPKTTSEIRLHRKYGYIGNMQD